MTEKKDEIFKSRMFARQQLLEGWDQEVVSNACVMIVGVGALGCEIAKDFTLMGIGKLILVDLDTIETSNLSRQMLFRPGDEGRPKAEVAAERLKQMNPFLKVDFHFEKLQKLPMSVYKEADVVIAALDNFNARLDLNKICLRMKKPMIEGGTVGFEGHVQIVIPEGSGIQYKNKETEIDKLIETKIWELTEDDYPEYFKIKAQIEEMEATIEILKERHLKPVEDQIRKEVEEEFDAEYAPKVLNLTPCYRCVVPIPPADDKLIAACTLKGIPLNRNHCVIKADVDFQKKLGHKADLDKDEEVLQLKEMAQNELEQLRERVLNENVPPEKREGLSPEELDEWKENIKRAFGPDFKFEEMENILGNKIPAIQSVSAVISSLESQEALKLLFRVKGRNVGVPMDPPYINYNGIYGQFDQVNITRRDDCLACGKIEGEENITIAVPFDADIEYVFKAMEISGYKLEPQLWMITNPMNKEIYWNPLIPSMKDPKVKLTNLQIKTNDIVAMTPFGKAKEESPIKKYNVVIQFM